MYMVGLTPEIFSGYFKNKPLEDVKETDSILNCIYILWIKYIIRKIPIVRTDMASNTSSINEG